MVFEGFTSSHTDQYTHHLAHSRSRASSNSVSTLGAVQQQQQQQQQGGLSRHGTRTRPQQQQQGVGGDEAITEEQNQSAEQARQQGGALKEEAATNGSPSDSHSNSEATIATDDVGTKRPSAAATDDLSTIETPLSGTGPQDLEAAAQLPTEHEKKGDAGSEDPYLVTYAGREHLDPHSWSFRYRCFLTAFAGLLVLNASFASSAPSNLIPSIISHYGASEEVGILTISIFVVGYCIGPLLWGPLSEKYGRRNVFLIAFVPYTAFQVGCALSPNVGSLLVFRFLGGCFAASPLTNSGGVIADLWEADRRGNALGLFALTPFAGPAIAPIVSGYMQVTGTDFRWIFWVLTIFAGVCTIGIVFLLPETYGPYILYQAAKKERKKTKDENWYSPVEKRRRERGTPTLMHTLDETIFKPFIMIIQEPMLLAITLYMSFVYGVIYLLFESVPIVFGEGHGLNSGKVGLVFLSLPVGGTIAVIIYVFYFNNQYTRLHHSIAPRAVAPEKRLDIMLWAAPALAFSFFWFAWTAYPSISIWSPILALTLLGGCVLYIFLGGFNYLIDSYLMNAASALAINTVVRSAFGAGFPLFATQMYEKLGTQGATSLLGGLAVVFLPVPFLLKRYGFKVRSMSKNAIVREDE